MIVVITIFAVINIFVYGVVLALWSTDCKEIGKENLAVPLSERLINTFIFFTLPAVIGVLIK